MRWAFYLDEGVYRYAENNKTFISPSQKSELFGNAVVFDNIVHILIASAREVDED